MNVLDEPADSSNKEKDKKPIELPPLSTVASNATGSTAPPSSTPPPPPAPKAEPVVTEIRANVDINQKPKEIPEPINLLDDKDFFAQQTQRTEGDFKQQQEREEKLRQAKAKLNPSSEPSGSNTNSSAPSPSSPISADKRKKQADKWVKAIDIARVWGLKMWSGQADDVGLKVPQSDLDTLGEALADVMEEYNFDPAPLLTLGITTVAVFGTSISNASETRKKLRSLRKTEEFRKAEEERLAKREKPDIDPHSGQHKKRRGGQPKG